MSERWRPEKLYRDRAAGVDTDGVKFRDPDPVDQQSVARVQQHMARGRTAKPMAVFFCNHGVHWQVCTTCSKAVR